MSDDNILRQIGQEWTEGTWVMPSFLLRVPAEGTSFQNPDGSWSHVIVTPGYHAPYHRQKHEGTLWHEKALGKATRRANRLWALVQRGVLTDAAYRVAMAEIRQRYGIEVSNG